MKIQILSDLHNEYFGTDRSRPDHHWTGIIPESSADVVVLAGDIDNGTLGVEWAVRESARLSKPVIYVPGNHEYYYHEYFSIKNEMPLRCAGTDVHCLDCGVFVSAGVRIIGATLWTDYAVNTGVQRDVVMAVVEQRLPDHRVIGYQSGPEIRRFTPLDARSIHARELSWLKQQLNTPFEGKTVVVSHHGPHHCCQHPGFALSELTGAFYSDLSALIEQADIDVWVYGHTHSNLDVVVSGTRIVSNQAGYPGENVTGFNDVFMVEV